MAVILYTAHGERGLLAEGLDCGARGYVLKDAPPDDIVRAVKRVAEGGAYVDPTLASELVSPKATEKLPALSTREREILGLLANGFSNPEIASRLFTPRQPGGYRADIRRAQTVRNVRHAVRRHRGAGLRPPRTELGTDVVIGQPHQAGNIRLHAGQLTAVASRAWRNLARGVAMRHQLLAARERIRGNTRHGRGVVGDFLCRKVFGDLMDVLGA